MVSSRALESRTPSQRIKSPLLCYQIDALGISLCSVCPALRRFCCRAMPLCGGLYRDIRAPTEHPRYRQHGHRRAHVMAHDHCPKPRRTGGGQSWPTAAGCACDDLYRVKVVPINGLPVAFRGAGRQRRSLTLVDVRSGRLRNHACSRCSPLREGAPGARIGEQPRRSVALVTQAGVPMASTAEWRRMIRPGRRRRRPDVGMRSVGECRSDAYEVPDVELAPFRKWPG
jgi:hypothetical protein